MELFIVRHGIAEALGKGNQFSDEKRVLTNEGRNRMREIAKGFAKLAIEVDLILSSPLARAVETAEIVAAAVGQNKKDIKTTENLSPGASCDHLFAEIKSHPGAETIVLVGHQPDLGILLTRVIQGAAGGLAIQLKKGTICCINVTETVPTLRGDMMWLLTPRQLRLIAKT
jgi:phosphohistidine phosphatase